MWRNSIKDRARVRVLFAILLIVVACDEDKRVSNGTWPGFSFRVEVDDINGDPVGGIRVSALNHLSNATPTVITDTGNLVARAFSTSFPFSLERQCRVDLSIYDLTDRLVDKLVDDQKPAGVHEFTWLAPTGDMHNGAYKCRLSASDTLTDELLFTDSIYAVLWQPDPEKCVLGFTSARGLFETRDSLLFPNVISLPLLTKTTYFGIVVGTFSFLDTVTIWLTDTVAGKQQIYEVVVKKGHNHVRLTWDPTTTVRTPDAGTRARAAVKIPVIVRQTATPLAEWHLGQNYPNPFF